MAEVRSADQATEIAVTFLKKHRQWVNPVSATRTDDIWEVQVDVGVFKIQIATFHIEARTGKIKDYSIPKGA